MLHVFTSKNPHEIAGVAQQYVFFRLNKLARMLHVFTSQKTHTRSLASRENI
jgi:hypothetical protein